MSDDTRERSSKDTVQVTLIVVAGLIILACFLGFTAISVAFFLNPPWQEGSRLPNKIPRGGLHRVCG